MPRAILLAAFTSTALMMSHRSSAATFTWDPAMTGSASGGGSGTWDTTTSNWYNGAADTTWPNLSTSSADFENTAGTITIATGGVTTNQLLFGQGYTLGAGTSSPSVTLAGASPEIADTGSAGSSVTLLAPLAGTGGFTWTHTGSAAGTLLVESNNSISGTVTFDDQVQFLLPGSNTSGSEGFGSADVVLGTSYFISNLSGTGVSLTINLGSLSATSSTVQVRAGGTGTGTTTFSIGATNLSTTFAGLLEDNSNVGDSWAALTKVGTGVLTLTNPNDGYTGPTQIDGGTLQVNGALTAGKFYPNLPSTVTVNGNSAANSYGTLSGSGTIAGAVDFAANGATDFAHAGHIAAEANGVAAKLTLNGGLTTDNYSNFDYLLNGASNSSGNSLIQTTNLALVGNTVFNFSFTGGNPAAGTMYTLINYSGDYSASSVSFSATGVPANEMAVFNETALSNGSLDVTFVAVPEPLTSGVLSLTAMGLLLCRRRTGHNASLSRA